MALPTVVINSAGSNTAASGAGPGDGAAAGSAVTGTAAAHTGGVATTTITLTNSPTLTGVAVDGSAALWLATASGRRWSKITAADNAAKTLTVEDSFTIASGSAVDYAVGGKRATCAGSAQLFKDFKAGWTVDIQTGETFTAALPITVTGTAAAPATITSTAGTAPVLTTATNSINLFDVSGCTYLNLSNLSFTNTAATKGTSGSTGCAVTPVSGTCTKLWVDRCSFDGFQVALVGDNITNFAFDMFALTRSEVKNSVADGARLHNDFRLEHCRFKGNGGHGVTTPTNAQVGPWNLSSCEFAGNSGSGVRLLSTTTGGSGTNFLSAAGCTFRDNGAAGVKVDANGTGIWTTLAYNVFYNNLTYGVDFTNASTAVALGNYGNAYGANGTLPRNNFPAGTGDVTLTANPFNSSTDSGLNSTAGGGAACKGAMPAAPNASANAAGDIGAVPSGGGGGGSGGGGGGAHIGGGLAG